MAQETKTSRAAVSLGLNEPLLTDKVTVLMGLVYPVLKWRVMETADHLLTPLLIKLTSASLSG